MESFGRSGSMNKLVNLTKRIPPISLGGSFETEEQLSFLISRGYSNIQSMEALKFTSQMMRYLIMFVVSFFPNK
jgi:hypothetical protein